MRRIGSDISSYLERVAGNDELARINMRTSQVRSRYKRALEKVYGDDAALHLAHTNNVIIKYKDGLRTLIVYVDESIFAAELNAQRELIQFYLLELFGEDVERFEIWTSRWKKYRDYHPYLKDSSVERVKRYPDVSLSDEQESFVAETASCVEDADLRSSLQRAMSSTLRWRMQKRA